MNDELFSSLDQGLLMYEMVEPYTPSSELVACVGDTKNHDRRTTL